MYPLADDRRLAYVIGQQNPAGNKYPMPELFFGSWIHDYGGAHTTSDADHSSVLRPRS